MDTMEINKIVGALVGALLIYLGAQFFAEKIFAPAHHGEGYAYALAVEEEDSGEAQEEVDPLTLIAQASPDRGERVFAKCRACHAVEKGDNRTGPYLYGVVGRKIDSAEGFGAYSGALEAQGAEAWTEEALFAFLASPRSWAPGTTMSFAGLPSAEDRAAVIAYLKTLGN